MRTANRTCRREVRATLQIDDDCMSEFPCTNQRALNVDGARPGSAVLNKRWTHSEVRAVGEGYLGAHLIARVSKARLRIGAAVAADCPLQAHEASDPGRASLEG